MCELMINTIFLIFIFFFFQICVKKEIIFVKVGWMLDSVFLQETWSIRFYALYCLNDLFTQRFVNRVSIHPKNNWLSIYLKQFLFKSKLALLFPLSLLLFISKKKKKKKKKEKKKRKKKKRNSWYQKFLFENVYQ